MKKTCSVCYNHFDVESPDVLTFSEQGASKYICPDCKELYETATLSRDPDNAISATGKLKELLVQNRDMTVLRLFSDVIPAAEERADAIRRGEYDFRLDEEDVFEEAAIDEELLLEEEDKVFLEEATKPAEKPSLFDRVLNWAWVVIGAFALGSLVYFIWYHFIR